MNDSTVIQNNSVQFISGDAVKKSVFTKDPVSLGDNLSFRGGFTFTLQSVGNTVTANDFNDVGISPSLSIAFTADYMEGGAPTARVATYSEGTITRCEISAVPYLNGVYRPYDPTEPDVKWPIEFSANDLDLYHV